MTEETQWGYALNLNGTGLVLSWCADRESAQRMIDVYKPIDGRDIPGVNWKLKPTLVKRRILVDEWEVVD